MTKKGAIIGLLVATWVMGGLAEASTFRTDEKLTTITGTLNDDLYVATETLALRGRVNGEVFGVARRIRLDGSTAGSVGLAAETVTVNGSVEGSARVAGRTAEVSGTVAKDLLAFGQTVLIDEKASVGRDVFIGGEEAEVSGTVGRNLRGSAGKLLLNGEVIGNVNVEAEEVELGPDARIRGDLVYTSPEVAEIASGAVVTGQTRRRFPAQEEQRGPLETLVDQLQSMLGPLLLGMSFLWLVPSFIPMVASRLGKAPGLSFATGLGAFVLIPISAVLLFGILVTLGGGWSVAGFLLAAYGAALLLTRVIAGYFVGEYLLRRLNKLPPEPTFWQRTGTLALGVVLLTVVMAIPGIGSAVRILAVLFTLGALTLSLVRNRAEARSDDGEVTPPPAAPESPAPA